MHCFFNVIISILYVQFLSLSLSLFLVTIISIFNMMQYLGTLLFMTPPSSM